MPKPQYIKIDGNFRKFLIKHTVLASAITFLLGFQIRSLISELIDTVINPLFSVDLNNDGEPDLKQIRKFTANIFGIKYPVGKLFLELIKTAVTIFVIYLSVVFITRYTDLM